MGICSAMRPRVVRVFIAAFRHGLGSLSLVCWDTLLCVFHRRLGPFPAILGTD